MSRKTYLQCINSVLRLMRRSTVSTNAETSASILISEFVNQAVQSVEAAHKWSALLNETNLSLTSGNALYSLLNWQDNGRIELVRNTTSDHKGNINRVSAIAWAALNHDVANAQPSCYRLRQADSSGDPQIEFHPTPEKAYSVTVYGYVGQGSLMSDSTMVCVPSNPVILLALSYAIRERGEDGGTSFAEADARAYDALQDAISLDMMSQAGGYDYGWELEHGRVV